jgi:hypothetical protein
MSGILSFIPEIIPLNKFSFITIYYTVYAPICS